jgi:ketopantoate reductase
VLARGQRLADIRRHGIVVEDWFTGERTTTAPQVVDALRPEDAYDLVLVIMGKHQTGATLPALAANRHTPIVAFLGNNAAGPDEYVAALGRKRVLIGFAGGAGTIEGHVVRGVVVPPGRNMPLGETAGPVTARVQRICEMLNAAGLAAMPGAQTDAWLKTHAALIVPMAGALAMAGGDLLRLAGTRDALVWLVRALRENMRALRALGVPIIPRQLDLMAHLPEPLLVAYLGRILRDPHMAVGFAHAHKAHPEMSHLAGELLTLTAWSGVPAPLMHGLLAYFDGREPPLPEGSADLALDWRDVEAAAGVVLGLTALVLIIWRLLARRRG